MLSNTSRYAIRALLYLAVNNENGKMTGIKKIAEDLDIPSPFLGKILQTLTKHKILLSTKGPNGGFGVSDTTLKTSLMDIIKIIDGDDLFYRCLITNHNCPEGDHEVCALHGHYQELRNKLNGLFSADTIGSLAQEYLISAKKFEI
jgi:Rrf2 family transcriptional regulator, iron-sulfur cluster assembly transcription factor